VPGESRQTLSNICATVQRHHKKSVIHHTCGAWTIGEIKTYFSVIAMIVSHSRAEHILQMLWITDQFHQGKAFFAGELQDSVRDQLLLFVVGCPSVPPRSTALAY